MTSDQLIERLRLIEALFAGAATPGEREAAAQARERIRARLQSQQVTDPPVEYRFSLRDRWSRQLFVALLRRYEIRPYRYARQRHTTLNARVSRTFVNETLWPEFQELSRTLEAFLAEVTEKVIREAITTDASDVEVRAEPSSLPLKAGHGGENSFEQD